MPGADNMTRDNGGSHRAAGDREAAVDAAMAGATSPSSPGIGQAPFPSAKVPSQLPPFVIRRMVREIEAAIERKPKGGMRVGVPQVTVTFEVTDARAFVAHMKASLESATSQKRAIDE